MTSLLNNGIIEVATLTPMSIHPADPKYNVDQMLELIHDVNQKNRSGERHIRVAVYPELCVTAYNCGELFNQSALLDTAKLELKRFAEESNDEYNPLIIVGMPLRKDNQLFNCAVAIHRGKFLGVVPKTFLPNYTVLYEARYFCSALTRIDDEIMLFGETVPFTPNLLWEDETSGAIVSAEICEDLWMNVAPSALHCLHGANIVVNLSSSNQTFGKTGYREELLRIHSSINVCGYIYTCATAGETQVDSSFAGHNLIVDTGDITAETKFMENKGITYGEIDIDKVMNERALRVSYMTVPDRQKYDHVYYKTFEPLESRFRSDRERNLVSFMPSDIAISAKDALDLQVVGLAERLKKNDCDKAVLSMSSGINSVLGLIATVEAFKLDGYDTKGIIGVTMPCEGKEKEMMESIRSLMSLLNVTSYEVGFDASHKKDEVKRVGALMDAADKYDAVILGVANMTEVGIGESHKHGDRVSVYAINAAIPVTVIRSLIYYYAERQETMVKAALESICSEYFDYELLMKDSDKQAEYLKNEEISSNLLYDFILHHMLKYGFGPRKIYELFTVSAMLKAGRIGEDISMVDKKRILERTKFFYKRFFEPSFKRGRISDTTKVFSASLVPNDWRMPSDPSAELWLRELDGIG